MDTTGIVYVLEFDGTNWSKTFSLKPNVMDMQLLFGYSVSLFKNRVLIGEYGNNDHGNSSRLAYIFEIETMFHNGFE